MFDKQVTQFDSEEGVSPVIGVILMVAITVILAAVIATFVLGLAGDLQQSAQASVSFDEDIGEEVTVQLTTVQSADSIWVSGDGNLSAPASGTLYSSSGVASTSTNSDLGGSAEFGPAASGGDAEQQYLLTRAEPSTSYHSGPGTVVTVNTSNSADGQLSVLGEVEGSNTVIQTYDYTGGS